MPSFQFACKDIGMSCGFHVEGGSSKSEVLEIAQVHAKHTHQITSLPPELVSKVQAAVRS